MEQETKSTDERIGRIEVSVANLEREFAGIQLSLNAIGDRISKSRETNWSVILSAVMLMLAVYAAAIRPLEKDIDRQGLRASDLADAVLLQNNQIQSNTNDITVMKARAELLKTTVDEMQELGTRNADKRLELLEYKVGMNK